MKITLTEKKKGFVNMTIGIIGAMQMEVDNLKKLLTDASMVTYSGVDFVCGKIGDKDIVVAKSGVGKVFAAICAEAMILKFDVDMIINVGVAGTLTKELGILDVAVASNVCQYDMDTSPVGDPRGLLSGINMIFLEADEHMNEVMTSVLNDRKIKYKFGTIATGDQFINTDEQRHFIRNQFEAIAGEMEGGSIGHVCYVNNVPFTIIRSISDGEGGHMDYEVFAEQAAIQSIDIVVDFINAI